MQTRRFVGLIILGTAALISAITSVTVAAISLTQQVHTAQYVDSMSKNVSLTLATQEAIERKLEMRVDALEEAVIHIGTELQALKVKMALSCHADYWWICVTPLKVNETDFEWEKIKNHISGIWNSSDIGLDLGKLHNQIATMEHSRLDFTAAGTANDFFHTFPPFMRVLFFFFFFSCVIKSNMRNLTPGREKRSKSSTAIYDVYKPESFQHHLSHKMKKQVCGFLQV